MTTLHADTTTAPFWAALAAGSLVCQQCESCGHFQMPPTPVCPACLGSRLEMVPVTGDGHVYAHTVLRRAFTDDLPASVPYIIALVELDDAPGARVLSILLDVRADELRIGLPVRYLEEHSRARLPYLYFTSSEQA
jgi:uncharacterized protein